MGQCSSKFQTQNLQIQSFAGIDRNQKCNLSKSQVLAKQQSNERKLIFGNGNVHSVPTTSKDRVTTVQVSISPLPSYSNRISWVDLIDNSNPQSVSKIGNGSFGIVVKTSWHFTSVSNIDTKCEVAVKVLTRSLANISSDDEFHHVCNKAIKEVDIIRKAEENMIYKDCIIQTYGIVKGPLPLALSSLFHVGVGEESVGIVMRLERGGSLDGLIHRSKEKMTALTLSNKINILFQIARGIAELHAVGIVHGDIKPENILLNEHWPPQIRLADFGFSTAQNLFYSTTLRKTRNFRGTPLYSAPEMFVNPYQPILDYKVAKSSRKTDVYAFAMLSWEFLTQVPLFREITTETVLTARLHQGHRPSLLQLPEEIPQDIKRMLVACWDGDRKNRWSAIECMAILQGLFLKLTSNTSRIDVLLSASLYPRGAMDQIYHHLTRMGLTVKYDDGDCPTAKNETATSVIVKANGAHTYSDGINIGGNESVESNDSTCFPKLKEHKYSTNTSAPTQRLNLNAGGRKKSSERNPKKLYVECNVPFETFGMDAPSSNNFVKLKSVAHADNRHHTRILRELQGFALDIDMQHLASEVYAYNTAIDDAPGDDVKDYASSDDSKDEETSVVGLTVGQHPGFYEYIRKGLQPLIDQLNVGRGIGAIDN